MPRPRGGDGKLFTKESALDANRDNVERVAGCPFGCCLAALCFILSQVIWAASNSFGRECAAREQARGRE